jgi:metallo-beta-lactamase class B
MEKIVLIFLYLMAHSIVFSQENNNPIRVSNDIELIKLSENAYIHVSNAELSGFGRTASNGLIYINGSNAFLFDTPVTDSLTKDLITWLRDSMNLEIVGFVPNHWHIDCMGGLKYLNHEHIESYANQMTIDIARSKNLPLPLHGFKDSVQIQLGDKIIRCYYLGAAHSLDNIVVWIPSEQILFAGCMIKSTHSNNLGNTSDGDQNAYPQTIEKIKNQFREAQIVIPGHGAYGGPELIEHTLMMAKEYQAALSN